MKRCSLLMLVILFAGSPAFAAALGTATREVIPSDVQQIISVDYRRLNNSPTATELHNRVLPDSLKQFESALKGLGIDPARDIDQLTFASFRNSKQLRFIGVAQGEFPLKHVMLRLKAHKIKPARYHNSFLYGVSNGLDMSLLNDNTMLFGEPAAIKMALDARDGNLPSLNGNSQILDLMPAVDSGAVWSVMDSTGTQTMMQSAMGDVAKLGDYQTVNRRLDGSRYAMNFGDGVNFDLDVITSDNMTAATLSTLVKAGMLYKKLNATGTEKLALDSMSVDSDSNQLKLHFKTDDKQFDSLLNSNLFATISR